LPPFHGTFEHSLDSKNRLTVPAKFRNELRDGVFLVRGEDPCLSIFPAAVYEETVQASLARLNPMSRSARQAKRLFYANADAADLDSAGRVTLAANQLRHAGIDGRDVVVTGAGDSLDVWSPAGWATYEAELIAFAPQLTEALDHTA
jgi:MraZ protein